MRKTILKDVYRATFWSLGFTIIIFFICWLTESIMKQSTELQMKDMRLAMAPTTFQHLSFAELITKRQCIKIFLVWFKFTFLYLKSAGLHAKSFQSCLTLWDPMDCSPPGSSAHGILQARTLEWVAIHFFRWFSQPRDQTCIFDILHWQVSTLPLAPYKSTGGQNLQWNPEIFLFFSKDIFSSLYHIQRFQAAHLAVDCLCPLRTECYQTRDWEMLLIFSEPSKLNYYCWGEESNYPSNLLSSWTRPPHPIIKRQINKRKIH